MSAPELKVYNDCRRSPGNTKGLNANTTNNKCTGNTDDDGWFKFTALTERTQVSLSTDQLTDMGIAVFQNCTIEVACIDGKGIGGQEILKFDSEIGETYFVQVYEVNEGGAEFLICISALDPIPEMDCLTPIVADFNRQSPTCQDPFSGSILINLIEGGTPPYSYQINDLAVQANPVFSDLSSGQYQITIQDTFGCQLDTSVQLLTPNFPMLDIGDDLLATPDETIQLTAVSNLPQEQIATVEWNNIDLEDCLQPCFTADFTVTTATTIQATLTTTDGCQITDDLQLTLPPKIDIYIPSAFSPNGDGINDFFTIFTSPSITNIRSLQIGDRWGNLVFQAANFPPNQASLGWNGTFNNRTLQGQSFIYLAIIEMPDGEIKKLSGELVLIL